MKQAFLWIFDITCVCITGYDVCVCVCVCTFAVCGDISDGQWEEVRLCEGSQAPAIQS